MRVIPVIALVLLVSGRMGAADEVATFPAYIDSDLCSHLMIGAITDERKECSKKTHKEGSEPVVVRLSDNLVLLVNKQKTIKNLVGELASVSGELKVNAGTMKIESAEMITADSLPQNDPSRRLLSAATTVTTNGELFEKVRHELAMLPYTTEFDFISFTLDGNTVILTGWTIRTTNRSGAENAVRNVPGVETVINNIEMLPVGSQDMQLRAAARGALQQQLSQYFWGSGSDIKIVVKNGDIILLGTVIRKGDSDIAFIKCNSLPGAFKVFNLLKVQPSAKG